MFWWDLPPIRQQLRQLCYNIPRDYLVDNFTRDFARKNIGIILELKPKTSVINKMRWLENFSIKVTEVLRYQFHCRFILGFLVTSSKIQMVLISRKVVFVSVSANFLNNMLLMRYVVVTLVASNVDLGLLPEDLFTHLSNNQNTYITLKSAHTDKTLQFDIL